MLDNRKTQNLVSNTNAYFGLFVSSSLEHSIRKVVQGEVGSLRNRHFARCHDLKMVDLTSLKRQWGNQFYSESNHDFLTRYGAHHSRHGNVTDRMHSARHHYTVCSCFVEKQQQQNLQVASDLVCNFFPTIFFSFFLLCMCMTIHKFALEAFNSKGKTSVLGCHSLRFWQMTGFPKIRKVGRHHTYRGMIYSTSANICVMTVILGTSFVLEGSQFPPAEKIFYEEKKDKM